ncbi:MAG: AAA family ATPase [Chitinophagales bacterium]|nr:AAA family ATPase [Chitinophagales bacterium]
MKKAPQILVLIGSPCSGKSTFAEYYAKFHDVFRINRDDLRKMLRFSEQMEFYDEDLLTEITYKMMGTALAKGKNLLIDNTHTKKEYLDEIIQRFNHLADIKFKVFEVPLEELLERNQERTRKVPLGVIRSGFDRVKHLVQSFDFSDRPKTDRPHRAKQQPFQPEKPYAVLCDLDGTLCITNRDMFNPEEAEILADQPNIPVVEVIVPLAIKYTIIFVSGREDKYKQVSLKWIEQHTGIKDCQLLMRKTGDYRKDSIIKSEILNEQILPNYNVLFAVDDRLQVCKMWYDEGIFCFNVNQGLIEF